MKLVSVPRVQAALVAAQRRWDWARFLPLIAKKSRADPQTLFREIWTGAVQIHLAVDEMDKAHALAGALVYQRGNDTFGEVVWCTGDRIEDWVGTLADLETYLRDECGCNVVRPVCRPGWELILKRLGYRKTHIVMEKDI